MSEQAASNAGEVKSPVSQSVSTESELLASVLSQMEARKQAPSPETEKPETAQSEAEVPEQSSGEVEAAEVEPEKEEGEAEAKQDSSAVLSKIDFEQLSEAEIQELAAKARSKALARFGELTSDKKALQGQIAQLQAELAKHQKPALEAAPQVPKEFSAIDSIEKLQAKALEMKETMEWAEAHLDNAEHLAANDVIETDNGNFTKADLKKFYRTARKAKDEWLPAQYAELQARAQRAALRDAWSQKAKQELKWLDGDDNDIRKQYEAVVKNPLLEKIKKAVPEAEPELEYIIGHAINSIHGKTFYNVATGEQTKPSVKLTPPAAVKSAAAGRANESISKQVKELESKFDNTRSEKDLEALLTARLRAKRI